MGKKSCCGRKLIGGPFPIRPIGKKGFQKSARWLSTRCLASLLCKKPGLGPGVVVYVREVPRAALAGAQVGPRVGVHPPGRGIPPRRCEVRKQPFLRAGCSTVTHVKLEPPEKIEIAKSENPTQSAKFLNKDLDEDDRGRVTQPTEAGKVNEGGEGNHQYYKHTFLQPPLPNSHFRCVRGGSGPTTGPGRPSGP